MVPTFFFLPALTAALVSSASESTKCTQVVLAATASRHSNCTRAQPTAKPSPYPHSPLANEFQYRGYDENNKTDVDARQAIHDAFTDLPPMLAAAIPSLRDLNDDTFSRYFPMFPGEVNSSLHDTPLHGRSYVEGVFGMLIDADTRPVALKPLTAEFKNERQDVGCCCANGAAACFFRGADSSNVCPGLFEEPMKASAVNCSELGDQMSWHMDSITSTLLHEFMRSDGVGAKAPSSAGRIIDVAYHPDNCARLAAGPEGRKAFINADSYSDFAL
ncbi:hypothetical protein LTR95_004449 [Oleoguttula sp. CCFEE 5521]